MIGYYVHHQGSGHLHRAISINQAFAGPMTGLSTHGRPPGWVGDWVDLPDDAGSPLKENPKAQDLSGQDPAAQGRLHYVPYDNAGLRNRMAAVSAWIERTRPACVVVDVSVEVGLLARLHGVPVIVMAQPGVRRDAAHRLAYDIADAIIAPWPEVAGGLWGATPGDLAKTHFVGAIGRFPPTSGGPRRARRVVVLNGTGGGGVGPAAVDRARRATPDWEWVHLDRAHGTWVDDPWPTLCSASVVVSHAGQNAIAEIAAARRPALLLPQERPFAEQQVMAAALESMSWVPLLVRTDWPASAEWPHVLGRLLALDGSSWSRWNDGRGAARAAAVLTGRVALDQAVPA